MVSSVVGHRVHTVTPRGYFFYRGFRFNIGGPGTGKSLVIDFCHDVYQELGLKIPIAPSSVTKASLVDELAYEQTRIQMGVKQTGEISAMVILASEYGSFIGESPKHDFFTNMSLFYDGKTYRERRRGNDINHEIKNPFINMLACTQPHLWKHQFPLESYLQGFASRCDFAFAEDVTDDIAMWTPLGVEDKTKTEGVSQFTREFAHDMQILFSQVANRDGIRMQWSEQAWKIIKHWHDVTRIDTQFKEPSLVQYESRRFERLYRDCMLMTLCRGDQQFIVEESDVNKAIEIFMHNEEMFRIEYRRAHTSDDKDKVTQVHQRLATAFMKNKRQALPHSTVINTITTLMGLRDAQHTYKYLVDAEALIMIQQETNEHGVTRKYSTPMYKVNLAWKDVFAK